MSMSTILESGTRVYVGSLQRRIDSDGSILDAKVCIHIGTASTGDFALHLHPAEAIRLSDCLIEMANCAAGPRVNKPDQEAA